MVPCSKTVRFSAETDLFPFVVACHRLASWAESIQMEGMVVPNRQHLESRTSVVVVGAGAIGTVVADSISHTADVTLIRRATTAAMWIDHGSGAERVDARIASSPAAVDPVDWIVLTTKAQQVVSAREWLAALTGPQTRIAILQNGIDHAERVSEWVPPERVVPAIVFISAERTGPDIVTVRQLDELVLPDTAAAQDFARLFPEQFPVSLDPNFETQAWRKLIMNAALNSVTALTGRTVGVAKEPGGRELIATVLREGIDVARARGVRLTQDELTLMRRKIEKLPPTAPTSMQLDRAHGRALEYGYLTGAVLKEAAAVGVPTPTTLALHNLISAL
ncbi:ketopantoate reductase family protein [Labedella populi]|nr:2-dehydropantoate 2-reductase [Labedella populi]